MRFSSGITGGSRSSARGANRSRKSRQLDTSSANVTLLHKPTGITATGQVQPGNYSRQESKKAADPVIESLWPTFEAKVAKDLGIPGR